MMTITHDTEHNHSAHKEVAVEDRHCGDLFELRSASIPPDESLTLAFSPMINLVMTVFGEVQVDTHCDGFELTVGQVWLVNDTQACVITNQGNDQDAVILSVLIKSTMLSRFFDRHKYDDGLGQNEEPNEEQGESRGANAANSPNAPVIFPSCELTRLTLESFRLFSQHSDDGLNALKLEELLLLKLKGQKGQVLAKEMQSKNDPAQEKFRRFMEDNILQSWAISDYAANIGMSLTSFKHMFSRVYATHSPKAWVNENRLRHADVQLRSTNKRMIDIALDCGFSSQSYFTQLYKIHYGVSPSAARK